jgi:hypothetical protein
MRDGLGSEYNQAAEVTRTLHFPEENFIVDSTIRSLQSGVSGSRHTLQDLVEIGRALAGLGVREIIVNLAWKDGVQVCEKLAAEDLSCKVVATLRARDASWRDRLAIGMRSGADEICIDSLLDVEQLKIAADLVQAQGLTISHSFSQLYPYKSVVELCRASALCGYRSQSFHDSFFRFGITPEAIRHFVRALGSDVPNCPPVYVHFSNFFGHATMTAVAALAAGATAVDASMNGIGHLCGHVSLPEVAVVLELLYGVRTGIKLDKLREVSLLVRERTGIPVPETAPVVGDLAFIMDGSFWAAEADVPAERKVYAKFPFPAPLVGAAEGVVWHDRTVTEEHIRGKLASMGIGHREKDVARIMARLTARLDGGREYPNWLSDAEFEDLCRGVVWEQDS